MMHSDSRLTLQKRSIINTLVVTLLVLLCWSTAAYCSAQEPNRQTGKTEFGKTISSKVIDGENDELFVIQEVLIDAPVEEVWNAYTTTEGWKAWVAPVAEVELKTGGLIRTNYRAAGKLTDEDANSLHIVNYVPLRMLTLQAEVSKNWPEIMKQQEKQLYNVIMFERVSERKTKLTSFGTGYKNTPEFKKLLNFFVPANEATYKNLIDWLENGEPAFDDK